MKVIIVTAEEIQVFVVEFVTKSSIFNSILVGIKVLEDEIVTVFIDVSRY